MKRTAVISALVAIAISMLMINLLPSSAITGTGSASGTITGAQA